MKDLDTRRAEGGGVIIGMEGWEAAVLLAVSNAAGISFYLPVSRQPTKLG
jgi:hypothetical protein